MFRCPVPCVVRLARTYCATCVPIHRRTVEQNPRFALSLSLSLLASSPCLVLSLQPPFGLVGCEGHDACVTACWTGRASAPSTEQIAPPPSAAKRGCVGRHVLFPLLENAGHCLGHHPPDLRLHGRHPTPSIHKHSSTCDQARRQSRPSQFAAHCFEPASKQRKGWSRQTTATAATAAAAATAATTTRRGAGPKARCEYGGARLRVGCSFS